jgi:hypothetical protein
VTQRARGKVDGQEIFEGDEVMVRGTVVRSQAGVGALVRFTSKTEDYEGWICEADLKFPLIDSGLPAEPADGTWLIVYEDSGNALIFNRDDANGHNDRDQRRHDRHWRSVVTQEWIDWPAAVARGAAKPSARRMLLLAEDQTSVDISALDAAMHAFWLHGNWGWATSRMDPDQREAAAAAAQRHHERIDPDGEPIHGLREGDA